MLTGGAGFLGVQVRQRLKAVGAGEVVVPRRAEFDLTESQAVAHAYEAARPEVVIHLAAEVGGIGANREHPGSFFYENAIMGIQLMEQARLAGVS